MGYFPNGTAAECYQAQYCAKCVHHPPDEDESAPMCAVYEAHWLYSYRDCNNKDSILHILIRRDKEGGNERCRMFYPKRERMEA